MIKKGCSFSFRNFNWFGDNRRFGKGDSCRGVFRLFKYSRLKPNDVVKRMSNMCLTMISDFNQALKKFDRLICSSIIAREDEIDRLHFVLLRQ